MRSRLGKGLLSVGVFFLGFVASELLGKLHAEEAQGWVLDLKPGHFYIHPDIWSPGLHYVIERPTQGCLRVYTAEEYAKL